MWRPRLRKKSEQVLSKKHDGYFADAIVALDAKLKAKPAVELKKYETATDITTLVIAASYQDYVGYLDTNNFIQRDKCVSILYARMLKGINLNRYKIYVTTQAREKETIPYMIIAAELDRRNSEDSFCSITIS